MTSVRLIMEWEGIRNGEWANAIVEFGKMRRILKSLKNLNIFRICFASCYLR